MRSKNYQINQNLWSSFFFQQTIWNNDFNEKKSIQAKIETDKRGIKIMK